MSKLTQTQLWKIENLYYFADINRDGKTTMQEIMNFLIKQGFRFDGNTLDTMLQFFSVNETEFKAIVDSLYASLDGMTGDQVRQLKQCFNSLDKNGDGKITIYEVNDSLMRQGVRVGEKQLEIMLNNLSVTKDEFVELFCRLFPIHTIDERQLRVTDESFMKLFQIVDKDHSGLIDLSELKRFLSNLGLRCNKVYLESLIEQYDTDHDKLMSLSDFVAMMRKLFNERELEQIKAIHNIK